MLVAYGSGERTALSHVLACYSDRAFTSLTRSTLPLLSYWRDPAYRLRGLLPRFGSSFNDSSTFTFEATVHPGVPRASPSQSDAIYASETLRLAIEAKWSEIEKETVDKWRAGVKQADAVLRAWASMLRPFILSPLEVEAALPLLYQALHRSASACYGKPPAAGVLYQHFRTGSTPKYHSLEAALARFFEAIRPLDNFKLVLQVVNMRTTDSYSRLARATQERTEREVADITRAAMLTEELFAFEEEVFVDFSWSGAA